MGQTRQLNNLRSRAAKPNDLSSSPRTHVVRLRSDTTHTHTYTKYKYIYGDIYIYTSHKYIVK